MANSNEFLYLFPSLSSNAGLNSIILLKIKTNINFIFCFTGTSKLQFQKHLCEPQKMAGIRFMTSNSTIFVQGFFCQLLVKLFQALNVFFNSITQNSNFI